MITTVEKERMLKFLEIMERNPKTSVTEGWRRTANVFDKLKYMYSACSSGKDSTFMTQMCIMELQRRRMILELLEGTPEQKKEAKELLDRYSKVRMTGLASQVKDDISLFEKWRHMRIAVMQMNYELEYDQSGHLMHRFYKEYATDINNILPKGSNKNIWESKESVEKLGFDLRWVNEENPKFNPGETPSDIIKKMTPSQLREIYGKALVFGYDMCFPIAWEHNGGVDDSRYISFEPDKREIWVNEPSVKYDPYREWCMSLENMYEPWHGLRPMFEVSPAMTDQLLRVEFSKYISNTVSEAMEMGWPEKKYNESTGKYE